MLFSSATVSPYRPQTGPDVVLPLPARTGIVVALALFSWLVVGALVEIAGATI